MRMMFLKEHFMNSLQSYMYAFQIAGCSAVIGQFQAAGSKRQKKRRYLRHQLVVAAASSQRSVASLSCCLDPSRDVQSVSWYSRLWDGKTAGDCCLGFLW
jgi:hypothetical protein